MMPPDAPSDAVPILSTPMGRLEAAFRSERLRLLRYLGRYAGRDVALDLVQEVFVRAAGTPGLAGIEYLPPYLTRIARKWSRHGVITIPLDEQWHPRASPEQAWGIEARDLLHIYRKTLRAMPPKTRRVFLLRRRHLTYREIAGRLGISTATVEYHVMRALAACRSAFRCGDGMA